MISVRTFLERRFYLVNLAVMGVSSMLVGLGATHLVRGKLLTGEEIVSPKKTANAPRRAVQKSKKEAQSQLRKGHYEVTRRNVFCSYCTPVSPKPAGGPGEEQAGPKASMGEAELLATLIASGDDRWSLATIRFRDSGQMRMVAKGSKLDDVEITLVEEKRVTFTRGGQTGVLELFPGQKEAGVPPAPAAGPTSPRAGGPPSNPHQKWREAVKQGVRKVGPNKYEIDRSLVSEFMANAGVAGRDAAIFPHTKEGKPDGFRLGRVRPSGIFARLGLRAGDVIQSINNQSIESPDKLLGIYTKLPGANHMTIGITRYGKPMSIDYSIK